MPTLCIFQSDIVAVALLVSLQKIGCFRSLGQASQLAAWRVLPPAALYSSTTLTYSCVVVRERVGQLSSRQKVPTQLQVLIHLCRRRTLWNYTKTFRNTALSHRNTTIIRLKVHLHSNATSRTKSTRHGVNLFQFIFVK